ncbi:MAG TPA: SDR family oxidoreductase [Bacteroidota bacterium]|nr:SDR family oxidoreductase [Bacteroidota bacterium]
MPEKNRMFPLHGRIAIVTGALGLLGKQHCIALAEAGAHVVVTDLDQEACTRYAGELTARGVPRAEGYALDVTAPDSVQAVRDRILQDFGRIDILVNNAAINDMVEHPRTAAEDSRFEQYPLAQWQRSIDVNLTGTFLCSQVFGTVMAERGAGSIVNIASTYGIVAPDQSLYRNPDGSQRFFKSPSYPATKGAVIAFTRYLAAYWGPNGVRANCLSPGGVQNGQDEHFVMNYARRTQLGRMATPMDYRGAIVFLAGDDSAYMTGANLVVDGGWCAW